MNRKNAGRKKPPPCVRASISFPSDVYQALEQLAGRKKVSLAWIVRDAAEQYIAGEVPKRKGRESAG